MRSSEIVISGRRLADVRARVGVPGVVLPRTIERSLAEARGELASGLNGHGAGIQFEDKSLAFAVHHRRAAAPEAAHARQILDQVVERFAGALRARYFLRSPTEVARFLEQLEQETMTG
jgi:trehalose-6-phosphatase